MRSGWGTVFFFFFLQGGICCEMHAATWPTQLVLAPCCCNRECKENSVHFDVIKGLGLTFAKRNCGQLWQGQGGTFSIFVTSGKQSGSLTYWHFVTFMCFQEKNYNHFVKDVQHNYAAGLN